MHCGQNTQFLNVLGFKRLTLILRMQLDFTLSVRKHAVPPPLRIHFTECTLQAGGVRVRQAYYRVRWRTPDIAHKFL